MPSRRSVSTIVIHPTAAGLCFTDEVFVPWEATNLPAGCFRFREREAFYWEVEMVSYQAESATLHLRVADFEAEFADYRPERPAKAILRRVEFAPLDRAAFCAQLSFYRPESLPLSRPESAGGQDEARQPDEAAIPPGPAPDPRLVSFVYPFAELSIVDGGVTGVHPGLQGTPLPFRIRNPFLVKEFGVIQAYFGRWLRRQTIEVTAEYRFAPDGSAGLHRARSAQIDRIDERAIEVLRARTLRDFIGQDDPDRRLFTPEELWERSADDERVRALLPPPGPALLEAILAEGSVRNARQLGHLAGRHERGQKLRFVLSPHFGFLFFVRGEGMHHFVLELLDSHATYVWSLPRDSGTLAEHYHAVTQEVQQLSATGRQAYRRANTFAHTFWSVRHEQIGSDFVDGFPRWRARLEEGLV